MRTITIASIVAGAVLLVPAATHQHHLKKPPVGYVMTSTGRVVKINDSQGCHFFLYTEMSTKHLGDPGDGDFYCAR